VEQRALVDARVQELKREISARFVVRDRHCGVLDPEELEAARSAAGGASRGS
jgi:hypothetical protein